MPTSSQLSELTEELPSLGRRAVGWLCAVMAFAAHLLRHDPGYTPFAAACAGVLAAAAVVTLAYARPRELPVVPIMLVHLYLSLGSAVFWPPTLGLTEGRIKLMSRSLDETLVGCLLFTACAVLACVWVARSTQRFAPGMARLLDRHEYGPIDSVVARVIAFVILSLSVVIAAAGKGGPSAFGPLTHVVTLLTLPAVPLGLLLWDAERSGEARARMLVWAAVLVLSLVGLGTGMLSAAALPAISLALLVWLMRGRFPTVIVIGVVTMIIGLNSTKHIYRRLNAYGKKSVSISQQAANWGEAISQTYSGSRGEEGSEVLSESAGSAASRFLTLPQVAQIFEWVPLYVPHAGADLWWTLPLEFVPRVVWSEKPVHNVEYNQRYTLTFRLQTKESVKGTSVALPPVGDGYWRLGWLGVAIEGGLLGILLGLYRGFARGDSRSLSIISCAALASVSADAHVMALYAGTPQFLLGMIAHFVAINGITVMAHAVKRRRFEIRAKPKLST